MKDKLKHIKKWITINKGYLYLMLITMVITILGLILGLKAGLSAGVTSVILILFANIYNYLVVKETIDIKELIYTFSGMILPIIIYSLILIC